MEILQRFQRQTFIPDKVYYLEELREMIAPMSPSARRAVLGENVARAYTLS